MESSSFCLNIKYRHKNKTKQNEVVLEMRQEGIDAV